MASMKRKARESGGSLKEEKDVCLSDSVLELSVTVGYLGADVKKEEMACLQSLLTDHCVAGMVALERGESESHLHFQMIVRARSKNARSFGVLVRKYMGWFGRRGMNPVGKVTCKVLSNRYMHTFIGMVGYCLKDAGAEHFDHCMHNISEEDVISGKTLHMIYGRADSKTRVTLTNRNITDRMFVWFKYRTKRPLTATFLSTLTEMIQSGIFIPSAAWIIPLNGQGMDHKRMTCLWRCITEPHSISKSDVQEIFVKKRNFVKGRYFDDDGSPSTDVYDDIDSPTDAIVEGMGTDKKPSAAGLRSSFRQVPRSGRGSRVLFEDTVDEKPISKSVCFQDKLGDYIGLKDKARMVTDEYLDTTDTLFGFGRMLESKSGEYAEGAPLNGGSEEHNGTQKQTEVIDLSSDSDEDPIILSSGIKVAFDRPTTMQKAERINISKFVVKKKPTLNIPNISSSH